MTPPRWREGLAARVRAAVALLADDGRDIVAGALEARGTLDPDAVARLLDAGDETLQGWMIRLLPVAAAYSVASVSGFPVGAVGRFEDANGRSGLVFGCNLETPGLSLAHTIHAEQAVVARAVDEGAARLVALAVSAPPCGHCRQFLHETSIAAPPDILIADQQGTVTTVLGSLLPRAFGPANLGITAGLLDHRPEYELSLPPAVLADRSTAAAFAAARRSHAPYSGNAAGVALEANGRVVVGGYLENAAFNPGLSPMHAAFVNLHLGLPLEAETRIDGAVLVERSAVCSQEPTTRELLGALAPDVSLQLHRISST